MEHLKTPALIIAALLLLSGCGFKPIYATAKGASPVGELVSVRQIAAPETLAPYVSDALAARLAGPDGVTPRYQLDVEVREYAERLAVQIDATVTRYNYRIDARYQVTDSRTNRRFRGKARAVTSYNIVSSQYSTLFAERTAIEKAARLLAEEIERDLLIRFAAPPEKRSTMNPESFDTDLAPEEILSSPRRGEVIEPLLFGRPDADPFDDPAGLIDDDGVIDEDEESYDDAIDGENEAGAAADEN